MQSIDCLVNLLIITARFKSIYLFILDSCAASCINVPWKIHFKTYKSSIKTLRIFSQKLLKQKVRKVGKNDIYIFFFLTCAYNNPYFKDCSAKQNASIMSDWMDGDGDRDRQTTIALMESLSSHPPLADDFESKFQFHPVEDLPPPDEFKPFPRIYPSKENRGTVTICSSFLHLASPICKFSLFFPQ